MKASPYNDFRCKTRETNCEKITWNYEPLSGGRACDFHYEPPLDMHSFTSVKGQWNDVGMVIYPPCWPRLSVWPLPWVSAGCSIRPRDKRRVGFRPQTALALRLCCEQCVEDGEPTR